MALNARDQARWDSLQDAGQVHIDRILTGRGSQDDLSAISRLLSQQHELAGEIFEQGVDDAVRTANTVVENLERQRIASGKRALTDKAQARLFNRAFQEVMSQAIEDILGRVHDEFQEQDEAIRDRVESALQRMQSRQVLAPEDGQPRSRTDRVLGPQPAAEEDEEEETPHERSLVDRVLDRQDTAERQRTEVMQFIRDTASAIKDRVTSLYDRFSHSNDEDREERAASIWMRKLRMLLSPMQRAWSATKHGASKAAGWLDMLSKPLLMAVMNPQLIQTITDEVSKILNFDNISKFVDSTWEETKKIGTDSLDWIIDKVKAWIFGDKKDAKSETKTSPVAGGAKPAPKVTELPKEISAADAQKALATQQSGLSQAQAKLDQAQARYKANPTAANKKAVDDAQFSVNYWQSRVTMYGTRAAQGKTAGSDIDQARTMVNGATRNVPTSTSASPSEVTTTPPEAKTTPAEVTTAPAPTTVANPAETLGRSNASVPQTTQVIGDMPKFTPGRTFESPDKKVEDTSAQDKGRAAISQIGMGSFGFDSPDSSLNILNLGMIS